MPVSRLQDDLLQEFREEKRMIVSQIELADPLALSLRKPAAQRLAGKGLLLFGEFLCWALFLGAIALIIFLKKIIPFFVLSQLDRPEHVQSLGANNVQMLQWGVYGIIGLCGLLFVFLARALARIRQKNDILHMAGSRIKTIVGQHLQRKAAIEAIEQRHFNEIPSDAYTDIHEAANPPTESGNEGVIA
jgi:branched-subunit amino acid transport protein AzlD